MPRSSTRAAVVAAAFLATVAVVLTALVVTRTPELVEWDRWVGAALAYRGGNGAYVGLLQVLTAPGLTVVRLLVLVPIAAAFAVRKRWPFVGFVLVCAVTVGPLTTLFKELVGRARPTYDDPLLFATGLSFPSGHSSGAAALAGALLVVAWPSVGRRWRPILAGVAVAVALCVAWTRLALGVHYLSDAVAGLALGGLVVLGSMLAFGLHRRPAP